MKYVIFSLVVLIMGMIIIVEDNNREVISVFSEDNVIKKDYVIECRSSCNIYQVDDSFKDSYLSVKEVYPRNKLSIIDEVVNRELDSFLYTSPLEITDKYKNILLKYGLYDDYDRVDIYGVSIEKVIVYTSKYDLDIFLLDNKNYKISEL